MAATTMPERRTCRHRRFGREWNRQGRWGGTLMRHFLVLCPVAALTFSVRVTASPRGLIAAPRSTNGAASCLLGTGDGAVAVTSIAGAANDDGRAAAHAEEASSRNVPRRSGPMGSRRQRPLREILCRQRRPSGLRGAASGLTWRLGPVARLRFHRPVSFLPHRQQICRASLARRRLLRNLSAGSPAGGKP